MESEIRFGTAPWRRVWVGILLCVVPAAAALAKEPAAAAVQRVDVHPTYYAAGGKRFAELRTLEDWVSASGARSIVFYACMGSANARLTAAIERLRGVYVDVRWVDPGKAGCPALEKSARY